MAVLGNTVYFRRITLCLLYIFYLADGSLISKSSVTLCENSDSEPSTTEGTACSKKILVTMGLKSGQKDTDSLYANIDRAYKEYEGEQELSRLKSPFRIEITKSEVIVGYELYYRNSANAKPYEEVVLERFCSDDWHLPSDTLACGKYHDGSEYVFDSQGFCCRCESSKVLAVLVNQKSHRGEHSCNLFGGVYSSAHCLRLNDLWYDVYDIGVPFLWYNITVDVLQFEGVEEDEAGDIQVNWTPVSTLTISPEKRLARSENGRVLAEIQGELVGGTFLKDFSSKYLLIPSSTQFPKDVPKTIQHTNGPSDWLILDKHLVDHRGSTCNKVGTYFTAFRHQQNPCYQDRGSCLQDQPLDYWEADNTLRELGKPGYYMMHNFGEIHPTTTSANYTTIMRFKYTDFSNTLVTFQIDASTIAYVYSVANGRIVNAYATNFEALRDNGFIYVEIENTGEVTSSFTVTVSRCSRGIQQLQGREVSLDPGQAVDITYQVQAYRGQGDGYSCEVELFDSEYNLLQTADVSFRTNGTCFCYGVCGCVCDPEEKIVCPEPPEVHVFTQAALKVFLKILEIIGAHGIAAILAGIFIILGAIKLCFGKMLCHRKSKAEVLAVELKKQGLISEDGGPLPVVCGGECSGAKAAKSRYERRAERMKRRGKKSALDKNWRNSSYACTCHTELTDVKCAVVLQALLFFFYCWLLPFIMIGKRVVGKFENTEKKKEKYKRKWVRKAASGGKGYKYLMGADLEGVKEDYPEEKDAWGTEDKDKEQPSDEEALLNNPKEQPSDEEALLQESPNAKELTNYSSGGEDETKEIEETDKYLDDVADAKERKDKGESHHQPKGRRRHTVHRVTQAMDYKRIKRHLDRSTGRQGEAQNDDDLQPKQEQLRVPADHQSRRRASRDERRSERREKRRRSRSRRHSKSTKHPERDSEGDPEGDLES